MHMELSISMGNAVSYRDIYREVSELEKLLDSTMNRRGRILYKDRTLPRGTTCTQALRDQALGDSARSLRTKKP